MAKRICSIPTCSRGGCEIHYDLWNQTPKSLKSYRRIDPDVALQNMRDAGIEPKVPFPGNSRTPWPSTCLTCGADVAPWLSSIRHGDGGCRRCGGRAGAADRQVDPDVATQRMRVAGVEPKVPYPGNNRTPWPGTCMECGADVAPRLYNLVGGQGGCMACGIRRRGVARRREGSPMWRGDDASYRAIHHRLRVERGPASDYLCVDCGRQADDWSYCGGSDREKASTSPHHNGRKYSPDLSTYSPRCRTCHLEFDRVMEAG